MARTRLTYESKEISHLFEGLDYFYPNKLKNIDLVARIQALDDQFNQFDVGCSSFSMFIYGLVKCSVWQLWNYPKNPYLDLCLNLSNAVDDLNDKMAIEPTYHSRKHFQDVCLALTILLMQADFSSTPKANQTPWHLDLENRWILLFSAIGHDFGHDGSINHSPFELEKASLKKINHFLVGQNCSSEFIQKLMHKVEPIILSTDPSNYLELSNKLRSADENNDPLLFMSTLMVESDLFASVLPKRGLQLSLRLGKEWSLTNPKLAKAVSSTYGRLAFLDKLDFFSLQARLLGLCEILSNERLSLKSMLEDQSE